MKKKELIASAIFIAMTVVFVGAFLIFQRKQDIRRLENIGNQIVSHIDNYKLKNHRYPDNLEQLNFNLPTDVEFGYDIMRDSTGYVLGFGIGGFQSHVYESDAKKWRDMD